MATPSRTLHKNTNTFPSIQKITNDHQKHLIEKIYILYIEFIKNIQQIVGEKQPAVRCMF